MRVIEFLSPRNIARNPGQLGMTIQLDAYFAILAQKTDGRILGTRGRGSEFLDWVVEGVDDINSPEVSEMLEAVQEIFTQYSIPFNWETYEIATVD